MAHAEVDRLLEEGVIERSHSPWMSSPVIVPKPNGKHCFCIDYRDVIKITHKDAYPLPNMDRILDGLRRARYISKIDLGQAYFQVPVEPGSRPITAFAVQDRGLLQFTHMPFGLTNAPATFQRLMDRLIDPAWEPHVFTYLDDVIIVTKTEDDHFRFLTRVLTTLRDAGLDITREKSGFFCPEVKYLGYVIDQIESSQF